MIDHFHQTWHVVIKLRGKIGSLGVYFPVSTTRDFTPYTFATLYFYVFRVPGNSAMFRRLMKSSDTLLHSWKLREQIKEFTKVFGRKCLRNENVASNPSFGGFVILRSVSRTSPVPVSSSDYSFFSYKNTTRNSSSMRKNVNRISV